MTTTSSQDSVCARIAQKVAQSVGPRRYSMWFDQSARFAYRDRENCLTVAVPNRFVADWISRHFEDHLRRAALTELGDSVRLRVEVEPALFAPTRLTAHATAAPAAARSAPVRSASARSAATSPATTPGFRHCLEDFIVGPSNELAFAAAQRLVEEDRGEVQPLFVHGGCGLGKTHLLQGICRRVAERRPGARVLYTTGERFTNEFLAAIRNNRLEEFRRRVRHLDLLAVDDVHFLANKEKTQQEFLHSFDAIELGGARVVLASDSHPKLIRQFSEALVSRCVRGMVVEVRQPDTATRIRIVRALALRRGIPLLETVAEVLAARCVGSVREIEGTLAKLHALATLSQQRQPAAAPGGPTVAAPIGHTLVNQLFDAEAHQAPRHAVRIDTIIEVVGRRLGVTRAQMAAEGRQRVVVLARSLAIHLARQMTSMSYPEIAATLGRGNHSTIITAAQRVERQLAENAQALVPTVNSTGEAVPGGTEQMPLSELVERLRHDIQRA